MNMVTPQKGLSEEEDDEESDSGKERGLFVIWLVVLPLSEEIG